MSNHPISSRSKASQKQGSFPPPALPGFNGRTTLSDSRPDQYLKHLLRVATPRQERVSHGTQTTFLTCCPHYPGRSKWVLLVVGSPSCIGLPRIWGGSASTTVLSGPSQGSLALRPVRLLQSFRLTFVPEASAGMSPYPAAQVATGMNRQFPGRDSHPLVICAFVAHPDIVVAHFSTGCSLHSSYMHNESNALLSAQSCSNMLFQTSKIRKLPTSILSQGRRNAGNRKVINDLKSRHTHPTMARTGHRIPLRTESNCRHYYYHHRRTAGWAASPNSRKR